MAPPRLLRAWLPTIGGEASDHFLMGNMRMIHFIAGYVFAIAFAVRVYWAIVGNHYARELFILPVWWMISYGKKISTAEQAYQDAEVAGQLDSTQDEIDDLEEGRSETLLASGTELLTPVDDRLEDE